MSTPESLICTSVDDCRISLKCMLQSDPGTALDVATRTLSMMDQRGIEQKSRRSALQSIKRQALRALK